MAKRKKKQNRRSYGGYRHRAPEAWQSMACDCGMTLTARGMARHRNSATHRNMRRIKALLNTPCITLEEIAARVGFSKQRVHQVANLINVQCGERQTVCGLRRRQARNDETLRTGLLRAVIATAQQRGLAVETTIKTNGEPGRTRILLNGLTCHLHKVTYQRPYVAIGSRRLPRDGEFNLFLLPDGRWMVMPSSQTPRGRTLIAIHQPRTRKGMGRNKRHDYRDYIEAWHLLAKQESIAA